MKMVILEIMYTKVLRTKEDLNMKNIRKHIPTALYKVIISIIYINLLEFIILINGVTYPYFAI